MGSLPFRQIHLDFHTSEAIPGVGKDWDKGHFQEMLTLGNVNSINIFAKGHHGWCYYPTTVNLSRTHPTLEFDLLGAMIEACHEINVKCPTYLSAGLDEQLVRTHTQWLRRTDDGTTSWVKWLEAGYHEFCMNSPYLNYLIEQIEEVTENYDTDGIWLDIVGVRNCTCQYCIATMRERGIDPRDTAARWTLGRETFLNYARSANAAVEAITPGLPVFHNSGHITRGDRELAELDTNLELESLPTGAWGYDHFPLSARYVQGLGKEFISMTGKFHTSWGEFGGYKHPNALRYESSRALANGAKMSVGDQMHPFGRLDKATYALVGKAFTELETKEPWCHDVTSVADVGVVSVEAMRQRSLRRDTTDPYRHTDAGVVRILQEGNILYDVIDAESDLSKYQVIVLPDAIPVAGELKKKLDMYIADGGKIFATWQSALDADSGEFTLDFGATCNGESATDPCYLVPDFPLPPWEEAAFVMYSPAKNIAATAGTVLADRQDAFFNRDYLHFCSHRHAPNNMETAGPIMVKTDNTVYLALPGFRLYAEMGQNALREIILHGIRSLLVNPTLVTDLPAQGIQTMMRQECENRTIVHLLYGPPSKRGQGIEVIEDLPIVLNTKVSVRTDVSVKRVLLEPQGVEIEFREEGGRVDMTVDSFTCHQMLVLEG